MYLKAFYLLQINSCVGEALQAKVHVQSIGQKMEDKEHLMRA
jgi:hypothetical protein